MSSAGNFRANLFPLAKQYGGVKVSQTNRMKELERENGRLKML
jgi:hypothetical protein